MNLIEGSNAISSKVESRLIGKFLFWIPAIIIMSLIFYLSSKQSVPGPSFPDYIAHFIAYGILAATYYFALRNSSGSRVNFVLLAFLLTSFYGLSDEIHQSFVPGRESSVKDWAVDSFAGLVVPLAWNSLKAKKPVR